LPIGENKNIFAQENQIVIIAHRDYASDKHHQSNHSFMLLCINSLLSAYTTNIGKVPLQTLVLFQTSSNCN